MKMIAIADCRGGVLDFFKIEPYRGQEIQYGDWCFDYNGRKHELERIRIVLKEIKRTYNQEISRLLKERQYVAYESTMRQRMLYRSMQKTIKDAHNTRTVGF